MFAGGVCGGVGAVAAGRLGAQRTRVGARGETLGRGVTRGARAEEEEEEEETAALLGA